MLTAPMGHAPIAMVHARDVADCAVAALRDDFASGADGAPTDAVRRLTGRPPRTLDEFLSIQKGN